MSDNPYQAPTASSSNDMMKCVACSKMLHISASTCPECGANQRKRPYRSKTTAVILGLLFGGLGVHRFYLGQWWGIFYLLFFWLWIPILIALVEIIVFACTSQESWDNKHNDGRPRGAGEGSGGAGIVIAVVVGIFVFISVIGILAAIALPAYQDYTTRAQVAASMTEAQEIKARVTHFYQDNGMLPESNIMLNLDEPLELTENSTLEINNTGSIVLTFNIGGTVDGDTLVFRPTPENGSLSWSCDEGSLEDRFRPPSCR